MKPAKDARMDHDASDLPLTPGWGESCDWDRHPTLFRVVVAGEHRRQFKSKMGTSLAWARTESQLLGSGAVDCAQPDSVCLRRW
eukprot:CAMPEP_0174343214 /NCGR_PEP_ID=MMETSP0810-20121108/26773_1 /TAXON_ID=73025 ORGANISM="Eutreptiella gymnastica-like, Strain CCMP1594" /NCGR_SAMPLE_ID=MMETSP0810 /ASSEMBLY_ACC=CAM_ASM_000659 /LENGTH=83 /DNA_ID=CAMNT_0015465797 /DNA_START=104 /DNA_END=352 /DNA_ORIENTATION=+